MFVQNPPNLIACKARTVSQVCDFDFEEFLLLKKHIMHFHATKSNVNNDAFEDILNGTV